MATPILDPGDPGLYSVSRGVDPVGPLMQRNSGPAGRYLLTSGNGPVSHDGADLLDGHWTRVFSPSSAAFGVLVLGVVLFLIHARADVAFRGAVGR